MNAKAQELPAATSAMTVQQNVVELRRYLVHPGQREVLVDLFERHFVESQEACGMSVLGQFRDPDRPDDFVWLRGFADMEARRRALGCFYDGPVWAEHRDVANATMKRFDDVLLLRPVQAGFDLAGKERPGPGSTERPGSVHALFVFPLAAGREAAFAAYFEQELLPLFEGCGAPAGVRLESERSANTYPRLPVRENENVQVWMAPFADAAGHADFKARLQAAGGWTEAKDGAFGGHMAGPLAIARLAPTARSLLR